MALLDQLMRSFKNELAKDEVNPAVYTAVQRFLKENDIKITLDMDEYTEKVMGDNSSKYTEEEMTRSDLAVSALLESINGKPKEELNLKPKESNVVDLGPGIGEINRPSIGYQEGDK